MQIFNGKFPLPTHLKTREPAVGATVVVDAADLVGAPADELQASGQKH